MIAHTPGPWRTRASLAGPTYRHITSDSADDIAVCTRDADAALIAAAPELLAALMVIVDHGGIGAEQMFHDARAAIAKAKGGAA